MCALRNRGLTKLASTVVSGRPFVDLAWHTLEQSDRDVSMLEGHGFQEESSGGVDPLCIGSPMSQTVLCKLYHMTRAHRVSQTKHKVTNGRQGSLPFGIRPIAQ
jgi:hypothetical protein